MINYLLFIPTFLLIFFLLNFFSFKFNKKISNVQDIHNVFVPRIGGVVGIIMLFPVTYYFNINLLYKFAVFIPFFILIIIDDLFCEIKPAIRLLSLLASFGIYFFIFHSNEYSFIFMFFSIFFFAAIANGSNMIDGANGLFSLTSLLQYTCLLFYGTHELTNLNLLYIEVLFFIFILNYPFQKIFMGDTGAFFFSISLILFFFEIFPNQTEILLNSIIIFLYPISEVTFSFLRKLYKKRNPLYPDGYHLHIMLFKLLNYKNYNSLKNNNKVAPILSFLWFLPCLFFYFYMTYEIPLIAVVLIYSSAYCLIYYLINEKFKKY